MRSFFPQIIKKAIAIYGIIISEEDFQFIFTGEYYEQV